MICYAESVAVRHRCEPELRPSTRGVRECYVLGEGRVYILNI